MWYQQGSNYEQFCYDIHYQNWPFDCNVWLPNNRLEGHQALPYNEPDYRTCNPTSRHGTGFTYTCPRPTVEPLWSRTSCRVRFTAQTVLDKLFPYLAQMITSMTFDLDLCLPVFFLAVTLLISWIMWQKFSTANLALAGFPLTKTVGENLASRL